MDFHSLVAANLPPKHRPTAMDAGAEDRYYRTQATLPHPRLAPLVSIATTVGVIALLTGLAAI
jgi:hypothetical protein